jgi:hypothetical protein
METNDPTIPITDPPALGEHTAAEARAQYEASHGRRVPKPKTRVCVCGCGAEIPIAREFAPGHLKAFHSRVKVLVAQGAVDLTGAAFEYVTKRGWLVAKEGV